MRFKKKQMTRGKSKKQPHWKELALLLSKKRQLNVVLRREIIPANRPVSSTSGSVQSAHAQDVSCNTDNPTNNPRNSLESYEEDIIRIKEEFTPTVPASDAPPTGSARASTSSINSEGPPPQLSSTLRPDSTEETNDAYNVSINDFQSLLMAATKRSDIRLSIENKFLNFDNRDEQPNSKQNDSEPSVSKRPSKYNRVRPLKRKMKQRSLPPRKRDQKHHQVMSQKHHQVMSQKHQKDIEVHVHENNSPPAEDHSETIQNKAQESQQHVTEQPRDLLILTLQKRSRGRPIKRKLNGGKNLNTEQETNDQPENTWKIKKGPKVSTCQTKGQDEQTISHISNENFNILENDKSPTDPEMNTNHKENKDHNINTETSDTNTKNFGKDLPEENSNLSIPNFGKRPRGRPRKRKAQNENIREKTYEEKSTQTEVNNIETCGIECRTKQRPTASVLEAGRKRTGRGRKSVAHELQLLRKRIIGVSQSQKRIQTALQSKLDDRFEFFGRTIAACLRELPQYYSQMLEVKLMDVLVEEKRQLITLGDGSHNGLDSL